MDHVKLSQPSLPMKTLKLNSNKSIPHLTKHYMPHNPTLMPTKTPYFISAADIIANPLKVQSISLQILLGTVSTEAFGC